MSYIHVDADVLVAGGGLAGAFAAIAAARGGCRTVLIQDRPVLGGNASSELFVGISGADCSGGSPLRCLRETGLIAEFADEMVSRSATFAAAIPLHSVILWEMVRREPSLTLYLNTSLRGAQCGSDGSIESVTACQTTTEKDYRFRAKWFIDCTGHGTLGAAANAEFRMGREAKAEFGESLAPEIADTGTMGASIILRARDLGRPVRYVAPDWAAHFPDDASLPFRHPTLEKVDQDSDEMVGFWWLEYGGVRDTVADAEEIYEELLRIVFGVWDHMKNTGDHGVANYAITQITPILGQRESRRLAGDHWLTEHDVRNATVFPDAVAYGGWPIDLHPPEGIYSKDPPCTSVRLRAPYGIPLRCLYSRNVPNLLFAGRNISVSHVALGSTRVMATCALLGQAAGTAAALCRRHGLTPREIGRTRIAELLQQLLKDDAYLIGVSNADPEDLARGATAHASSEATLEIETCDSWFELTRDAAQNLPLSQHRIDSLEVYVRSDIDGPMTLRVELQPARGINDWEDGAAQAIAEVEVAPRHGGWVRFDFRRRIESQRYYRLCLSAAPGLWVGVQADAPVGTHRAVRVTTGGETVWQPSARLAELGRRRGAFLMRLTPGSGPYGPRNVLSGINRPECWTNLWMSDSRQPLPQWVELVFPKPADISSVRLTFDDDLDANLYLPPPWGRLGQGPSPTLVRDYVVSALTADGWQRLAIVRDNHQRRRIHHAYCRGVKTVRLECQTTHGAPEARVCEIRVSLSRGIRRRRAGSGSLREDASGSPAPLRNMDGYQGISLHEKNGR